VNAAPTAAVAVGFGAERVLFVDPYTGEVQGEGATKLRRVFRVLLDWHRWLGLQAERREIGRWITGVCTTAFVVLIVTGFYLWWPRHWTRMALKAVVLPRLKLHGRARDWNWHNTAGCWSALALLIISLTGLVMSYQWANNLLYTLTGNKPPPRPQRPLPGPSAAGASASGVTTGSPDTSRDGRSGGQRRADDGAISQQRHRSAGPGEPQAVELRAGLGALFDVATQQAPHWRLITVRFPPGATLHVSIIIEEAMTRHPYPRSVLTVDAATAAVVKWEPYAANNLGRTLRLWVKPIHTGEAAGLIGQAVAALASTGGAVLVCTGLALAGRRFIARLRRVRAAASNAAPEVRTASDDATA
jgi:uncharacterized iron-regulated membrane protein